MNKIVTAGIIALLCTACGSAGTSAGNPSTSALQATVPGDLVVSSVTSSSSTSPSLSVGKAIGDPAAGDFLSKRTALQALIAATGDCAFTPSIPDVTPPICYGPRLRYCNHPDLVGTQDALCVDDDGLGAGPNDTDGDGILPQGDVGIWSEYEGSPATGEACAAAQLNYQINRVAARLDNATSLFATAVCAGRKAGLTPPAVGASVDLSAAMTAHATTPGLTTSTVTIARSADTSAGDPVYVMTIDATLTVGAVDRPMHLVLTHSPQDTTNDSYIGSLQVRVGNPTEAHGNNCANIAGTASGSALATVIQYEKTESAQLRYQMDHAEFCGETTNPFASSSTLDPTDAASVSNVDGWANNWNHGRFHWDPSTGSGSAAYAWQAGSSDGYTRVLDATVTASTTGAATGTAYFGFGPAVTTTNNDLGIIDGFFCNWAGPDSRKGNAGAPGLSALAQRQGLARAAGDTRFTSVADQLAIRYAPQNSCSQTDTNFRYEALDGPGNPLTLDNDNAGVGFDHTLIDAGEISFTLPTAPATL